MELKKILGTKFNRRSFFLCATALAGGAWVTQERRRALSSPRYTNYPFSLGVASGDPLPDSVVLWTRLAPQPLQPVSMPPINVLVQWQIATDPKMRRVVAAGEAIATPELAHAVHVVVEGLEPDRWYWYQFRSGGEISPLGRTRTAPATSAVVPKLDFAFVSCQNYEHGYFNAYRHLAAEDLNFVIHLGDYIYEYGANPNSDSVRQHLGNEAKDLNTYRQRYALYKLDPDLQAAHAAFPFICTWDDHEVDNDYANYWSENFDSPEEFGRRRAAAYQAYYEHLPLRPVSFPQGSNLKLYRRFTFGDLAQFSILDTRQYRSNQACECSTRGGGQLLSKCSQLLDPRRTMLGAEQEQWLLSGLNSSPTIWNVVAQQYLVAQLKQNLSGRWTYWSDGWDGYPLSRQRILEFIYTRRIANPIFLGGDIHSFWVSELQTDFNNSNSPSVATEFVGTSISSRGVPYERFTAYLPDNTHIKFFESRWRGYVKCSVEREKWLAHLRIVETVNKPQAPLRTLASFVVHRGVPGVQRL